jgi:hypothetical protein
MRAIEFQGSILVATPTLFVYKLAGSQTVQNDGTVVYDMPLSWSLDVNLTSIDAAGSVDILLSNDDPTVSTFITSPAFTYPVTAGKFSGNTTKQTVDSGFRVTTKYLAIRLTKTGGANGNMDIQGLIIY